VTSGGIQPCVPPEPTDEELIRRLARGDVGALAPLYVRHRGVVMTVLRQRVTSSADLEDLCHEVFLTLREVARRHRPGASVRSFLVGIAVQKSLKSRFRSWLQALREGAGEAPGREPSVAPHERLDVHLDAQRLLGALPEEWRLVVALNLIEGWTAEEIAESLGVRSNTVYTRLHRARARLRALTGEEP